MIRAHLDRFFRRVAPTTPGDTLLVAFSGGLDSSALLWELSRLAERRRLRLHAAHLDHALDEGSEERAGRAAEIARQIGVPLTVERLTEVPRNPSGGLEDWARRRRYDYLETVRLEIGSRYLVTAHHRDDQVETILLRWAMGSGLAGLAAMRSRRGTLVRPLLDLERQSLRESLESAGIEPVEDPTNRDATRLRNRLRRHLLPHLRRSDPELDARLVGLATASRAAVDGIERRLAAVLDPKPEAGGASVDLAALDDLPSSFLPFALAILHRTAGRPYPPGEAARRELARQLAAGGRIGCDCGDGWSWRDHRGRLYLRPAETTPAPFAYTLAVPGEVVIPPLGLRLSIGREPVAPWMFEGRPDRAALRLPVEYRDSLLVRNRRPGDRIRPLGCRYRRRLKEVLIDRAVPRGRRDRLPLLCRGERVLWVPGVTIDDDLRLADQRHPWVARLEPIDATGGELPLL